jgi:prenyltransferase beta subunit
MFRLIFALTLILTVIAAPVLAQEEDAGVQAAAFLTTMQNEDGGFTNGFAPESDISTTADVIVALAVAGQETDEPFTTELESALEFLSDQVIGGNIAGAGQMAKIITAVIAAGGDPTAFGDYDLVEALEMMQSDTGMVGTGAFDHCLVTIALQNAGAELPEGTVEAIVGSQGEDGGWGFMPGQASDTNTTGLCLQALALTEDAESVDAGLAYLEVIQNEDGGWPYQNPSDFGTDSDTSSTALVVQALIANEEDLAGWNNPQDWLVSMQLKSGAFSYQEAAPGDNIPATVAVIPAIVGVPLNAWAPVPETE